MPIFLVIIVTVQPQIIPSPLEEMGIARGYTVTSHWLPVIGTRTRTRTTSTSTKYETSEKASTSTSTRYEPILTRTSRTSLHPIFRRFFYIFVKFLMKEGEILNF